MIVPPPTPPAPATELYRDPAWQRAAGWVAVAVLAGFWLAVWELANKWTEADYSHGFLVPLVCGYLLWLRRDKFPTRTAGVVVTEATGTSGVAVARTTKVKGPVAWPNPWGLKFFGWAGSIVLFALKTNYAKEPLCGVALGVAFVGWLWMFCGGWAGVKWAWPALAFWAFAVPPPFQVEQRVGAALRGIATDASCAAFQLLGIPSYVGAGGDTTQRYMITLEGSPTPLDVAAPCAGLSMMLTFLALTAAICLLSPPSRPVPQRLFVFATALPIAIGCNILRIVVTGLVYHAGWKKFGDAVAHDMAGWLMMPLALGVIWVELRLMDWIWEPVEYATTGEVAKALLDRAREKVSEDDARRAQLGLPPKPSAPPIDSPVPLSVVHPTPPESAR